jgi:hypothetical protein
MVSVLSSNGFLVPENVGLETEIESLGQVEAENRKK